MSGPKSPYGYDPIFHQALAAIHLERPAKLTLESDKNPSHMRALFNQFRTSWMNQSQFHAKRKEYDQEVACRQNYYKLMQYECRRTMEGIELVARASAKATLKTEGQVELFMPIEPEPRTATPSGRQKEKPGVIKLKNTSPEELAKIRPFDPKQADAEAAAVFGIKLKPHVEEPAAPAIENKYGLPIGPPPGVYGMDNPAPIITDNPPPSSQSATSPDEMAFLLATGRPPTSHDELDAFLSGKLPPL
jgi:hypothetical protein